MATGSSATQGAAERQIEVADRLTDASFAVIVTLPTPDELVAAADLLVGSTTPTHVRVLGPGDRPPVADDAFVLATNPTIPGVDAALSATDPRGDVEAVLDGHAPIHGSYKRDDAARRPGFAAVFDDLARSIAQSTRLFGPLSGRDPQEIDERLAAADLPRRTSDCADDSTAGKRLAGWLATVILDAPERPASATVGLQRALAPVYHDHPTATVDGLHEVTGVLADVEPSLAIAALVDATQWDSAIERYESATRDVLEVVSALPVDGDGPLVAATTDVEANSSAAWLWTAFRLEAEYGLLVREGEPTDIALASTGARSASAVLEAIANGPNDHRWGDERIARAYVDMGRESLVSAIQEELE